MIPDPSRFRRLMAQVVVGLVLISIGLWMAAMSDPKGFGLEPAADRPVEWLAGGGLLCAAVGVLFWLAAVRQTTRSMPPALVHRTNVGVGGGMALQMIGFFLAGATDEQALMGGLLVVMSVPLLVWGCFSFAAGKGYPAPLGLLGLLGIVGLLVLLILPPRPPTGTAEAEMPDQDSPE